MLRYLLTKVKPFIKTNLDIRFIFMVSLFLLCSNQAFSSTNVKAILDNIGMSLNKENFVKIPKYYSQYYISSTRELFRALHKIRKKGGFGAVIIHDGTYHISQTIVIDVPNVMIVSASRDPKKVKFVGKGMNKTRGVSNIFFVSSSGFVLEGITLRDAGNHLIQIVGGDYPVIRHCFFQDAYQQLLKVAYNKKVRDFSENGVIENCLFEYTNGIGPNYYIGGIDAHGIRGWVIRNNLFRNIASPSKHVAEHAIHIWSNSLDNLVEGNVVINCDRGIGFGLKQKDPARKISNRRGEIRNNYIYHQNNKNPFSDVGINIEKSPGTVIAGNYVFLEHDYPHAIEVRFKSTVDVIVIGNYTNKSIVSLNGAKFLGIKNKVSLKKKEFLKKMNKQLEKIGFSK